MNINDFLFLISIPKPDHEFSPCSHSRLFLPGRGHVVVRCFHTVTGIRTLFLFLQLLDCVWNSLVPFTLEVTLSSKRTKYNQCPYYQKFNLLSDLHFLTDPVYPGLFYIQLRYTYTRKKHLSFGHFPKMPPPPRVQSFPGSGP